MSKVRLLSAVWMSLSALLLGQQASVELKAGDKAPDFALPNGDGKLVTLSEFTVRGTVVVIFYRGFW